MKDLQFVQKVEYGFNGLTEIAQYVKNHSEPDYTLALYDILSDGTMSVKCNTDQIAQIVSYVSTIEHDFPAWVGIDVYAKQYVVGLQFTRGRFPVPSTAEWTGMGLQSTNA